ncbi:MAG: DNA-3-methyladenine glycosylase [Candidatus Pacearchaeota archaeon]
MVVQTCLKKKFFERSPEEVAKDLLGKILVRKVEDVYMKARIVETEAYFGPEDPASRASKGRNKISEKMWAEPGTILVYNVHKYQMLNFVTQSKEEPSAVLIRALESLNFDARTKGPGLLTDALGIDKEIHGQNVLSSNEIWIEGPEGEEEIYEIEDSFRVGVTEDLNERYRFFIKGNRFVSRPKV